MEKAPKWFMPVAVLALLWNLLGCAMYLKDVMMSADDLAKLDAAQQAFYAARPAWATGATALAVWLGALGCVVLIFHRSWAMPFLGLSLLGLLAQDIYLFGMSHVALPATVYLVQALVLLIAAGLVWLARVGTRNNWLYARG